MVDVENFTWNSYGDDWEKLKAFDFKYGKSIMNFRPWMGEYEKDKETKNWSYCKN